MPKREDVKALKKIVEIREVQRAAAEMRAAQAASALRGLQAERDDGRSALADDQTRWLQSVFGRSLQLPLARAWCSRVADAQADLGRLDNEINHAETRMERISEALHLASARAEAAQELAHAAARQERRRQDEIALADLADRFVGRRSSI